MKQFINSAFHPTVIRSVHLSVCVIMHPFVISISPQQSLSRRAWYTSDGKTRRCWPRRNCLKIVLVYVEHFFSVAL